MIRFKLRPDAGAVPENQSVSGNTLANDSLAVKLTYVRFGGTTVAVPVGGTTLQGVYGVLTIDPSGAYQYVANTPQADALAKGVGGTDVFTYTAVDAGGASSTSTLSVKVTGANDAPVLVGTSATLNAILEDQVANSGQRVGTFLTSTDVDTSALKGIAVSSLQSATGKWQYSLDGRVTWLDVGDVSADSALLLRSSDYVRYVPNTETDVTASFTYRAWDQTSGTAGSKAATSVNGADTAYSTSSATTSIKVTAVNDAPMANPASASGTEDAGPINGRVTATDADSTTLSYALVNGSQVGGSVQLNGATGDFIFTPNANFNGSASFQFVANDGQVNSAPASATIAISPVNDAPTATADSASTQKDASVLIDVLANDSDIDGDTLSVSEIGSANNGVVAIEAGKVRYTPNANFVGSDTFTYKVSDGQGGVASAAVSVSVAGIVSQSPSTVSVTFREASHGYTGVVDTMLKQAAPNTPFGDAIVLRPDNDANAQVQGLLSFNNLFGDQAGQIPLGATIISAVLTLETTNPSSAAGTVNRMLVDWNANSTWNSLGAGVQIDGIEATSSGAVTVGSASLGTRIFNVTDSLQAWAAAGTALQQNAANDGWLFKPTSSDGWDFASAQGTAKPVLTVTYAPMDAPPPPAILPSVSIKTSVAGPGVESASGKIAFTITLDRASTQEVTVGYNTVDGTATSGSDYVGLDGSVKFSPGQTVKTIEVALVDDITPERLERFVVQLNSATNAKIGGPTVNAMISDDDVATHALPALNAQVVIVHNLADGSKYVDGGTGAYGISDPSGLAYVPGLDTLFIADSEHDESPFFSTTNMFGVRPNGDFIQGYKLTGFTKEPTGLAYNSGDGYLYIADDDKQGVFWVSPTNPSVKLGFFDTARLGFSDSEDLKFDPLTGHLHILDGSLKQIIELTSSGSFIDSIPLPSVMTDAEALAYDSLHDLFFVASGASSLIWAIDRMGVVRETIDVLGNYGTTALKGLEFAPSSDPNDGDHMSLFVADYGVDQQNDGRLFEINLGTDWWT
jgi:VCBS repeat-containing protein